MWIHGQFKKIFVPRVHLNNCWGGNHLLLLTHDGGVNLYLLACLSGADRVRTRLLITTNHNTRVAGEAYGGAQILFYKSQIKKHFCYYCCSEYGAKRICTCIKNCEVTNKFCSSANQYVNSSSESCTLVEYFLTNVLYIFLAQTQVHNYSCLNLLRWISSSVFRFQVTIFAHSPFYTKCTVKCGAKVSWASVEAVGGANININ